MKWIARQDGVALVVAMMAMALLTALGGALILSSSSETTIAAHFRDGIEARYAADTITRRVMHEIVGRDDWRPLIDGSRRSSWVDGPNSGTRTLSDGKSIDLGQVVNQASCQKPTNCSEADLSAVTPDRPWGGHNPRWTLYAHSPLRDMLPSGVRSSYYVLLLVGNGPSPDLLLLRAEAYGPHGTHAVVETTMARNALATDDTDYNDGSAQGDIKLLSWREVR